jgi:hypothetical protein
MSKSGRPILGRPLFLRNDYKLTDIRYRRPTFDERSSKMRLIKAFGLAAMTTVATLALVASSAMANGETVLCKENVTPCPAGKKVEHESINVLAEDSVAHPLLVNTNSVDVLCLTLHLKIKVLLLANPLVGHVEALEWLNCSTDGSAAHSNCTVTTITLGLFLLLKAGTNVGTLQWHGTEFLQECVGLHCVYGGLMTMPATGGTTLAGGEKGKVEANNVVLTKISGLFCPTTSEWRALFFITSPEHTYISE